MLPSCSSDRAMAAIVPRTSGPWKCCDRGDMGERSETAGLPMYDPPELRPAVDAWWSGLARAFRAEGVARCARAARSRPGFRCAVERARSPVRAGVRLSTDRRVGRPAAVPGDAALRGAGLRGLELLQLHRRRRADSTAQCIEDLRGARCSINSRISHSGFNALRSHCGPAGVETAGTSARSA